MEAKRWKKLQDLFHAALQRPDADREAFLQSACDQDVLLKGEVESLLAAHSRGELVTTHDAVNPPAVPHLLADQYLIEREIGRGGMAFVHLALDQKHERKVAVKVLRPGLVSALSAKRFLREIRVTANLQHPNILPLYDSGQVGEILYYVTPFMEEGSLRGRLVREQTLDVDDALEVIRCAASALDFAHRHGVVHRDIKPENILLREGQAIVADFGIARAVNVADNEQLTMAGRPIGTPNYMSPEQADGVVEVDSRADTYALACVLFECLTGKPPYDAPVLEAIIAGHQAGPIPSIKHARRDVSHTIDEAVTTALAKRPDERFTSIADFASAVGVPLHTPRTPVPGEEPAASLHTRRSRVTRSDDYSLSDQQIRFCTAADGTSIAYATVGEGPPLVKTANWLSHLEFDWQSRVWRHWWAGLAKYNRLIRYDERGCGLSSWDAEDFSLDAWVSDLEAVVDAAGVDRFPLLGISQGGPIAIAYAVRHPERVTKLILHGSYARGRTLRGSSEEFRKETAMLEELTRVGWGSDNPVFLRVFSSLFYPDANPDELDWLSELQRVSTSPENAVRIRKAFDVLDVRHLAPQVSVPTLVLHCKEELRIPFEEGRLLASLIPGARLVPLPSRNHIPLGGEPAWEQFLTTVWSFLGVGA